MRKYAQKFDNILANSSKTICIDSNNLNIKTFYKHSQRFYLTFSKKKF